MNYTEMIRREILRLARVTHSSAFISVKRLSALYNVPEKTVRSELTKLAEENHIRLAGWDGKEVRSTKEWRSKEEFVERAPAGVPVRVELVEQKTAAAKA
jgi:DeoR/GlpR family transcriptional regulator of sugar metabolism